VEAESRAVEDFLSLAQLGSVLWVGGEALEAELLSNPDPEIRTEAIRLLAHSGERVVLEDSSLERAAELERLGYGAFDALHLASAEQASASCLLTTDDRFLGKARRGVGSPAVIVQNPLDWRRGFQP
jgi:predicted nucleic acid-binding protein